MYGRLVTFTGSHGINTGAQLTGHTHSTPLDTPLVLQTIPIDPKIAPVRVVVVSPFATDAQAAKQAKYALAKRDYRIQPELLRKSLDFFHAAGNEVMKHITLNKEVFDRLPDNDVCPEIFIIDESGQLTPSLDPKTQTGGTHLTESLDDVMDQSS